MNITLEPIDPKDTSRSVQLEDARETATGWTGRVRKTGARYTTLSVELDFPSFAWRVAGASMADVLKDGGFELWRRRP